MADTPVVLREWNSLHGMCCCGSAFVSFNHIVVCLGKHRGAENAGSEAGLRRVTRGGNEEGLLVTRPDVDVGPVRVSIPILHGLHHRWLQF